MNGEEMKMLQNMNAASREPKVKVGEFPKSRMNYKADGLPLEEDIQFSFDDIEFEEMVVCMIDEMREVYNFAMVYNRFSEKYLTTARKLEKMVRYLGRAALTRTILEKQGKKMLVLPEDMIRPLYSCVSYNFRKTHDAIMKTTNKNNDFWFGLIDLQTSWYDLALRLKATEKKIQDIKEGRIKVETLLKEPAAARTAAGTQKKETSREPKSLTKVSALPIIKEAISPKEPASETENKAEPNSVPNEVSVKGEDIQPKADITNSTEPVKQKDHSGRPAVSSKETYLSDPSKEPEKSDTPIPLDVAEILHPNYSIFRSPVMAMKVKPSTKKKKKHKKR